MRLKIVHFFLLLFFMGVAPFSEASGNKCLYFFIQNSERSASSSIYLPELKSTWRKTDGSDFAAYRSNSPFIWNELKNLQLTSEASRILGSALGDGHDLNFDFVLRKDGKSELQLTDYDDIGENIPLLFDAAKRATGNTLTNYSVSHRQLWEAYIKGLQNVSVPIPTKLQPYFDLKRNDFENAKLEYFSKIISPDGKFSSGSDLTLRSQNGQFQDQEIQKIYLQLNSAFEGELHKQFGSQIEIIDVGFKVKKSGGSQGSGRFWYSIHGPTGPEIVEFKHHPGSSLIFYNPNMNFLKAFDQVQKSFHTDQIENFLSYVNTDSGHFWMRVRRPVLFSLEDVTATFDLNEKMTTSEKEEISLYLMTNYGRWQATSAQGQLLLQSVSKNPEIAYRDFENIILRIQKIIHDHK